MSSDWHFQSMLVDPCALTDICIQANFVTPNAVVLHRSSLAVTAANDLLQTEYSLHRLWNGTKLNFRLSFSERLIADASQSTLALFRCAFYLRLSCIWLCDPYRLQINQFQSITVHTSTKIICTWLLSKMLTYPCSRDTLVYNSTIWCFNADLCSYNIQAYAKYRPRYIFQK